MKCPEHKVEMRRIDETVNAYDGTSVFWIFPTSIVQLSVQHPYDGTSVFWICDGGGRFPRKHIVMTEEWAGSITFY